jgi:hypothetical protein
MLFKFNKSLFSLSSLSNIELETQFLNSLKEPDNDFERSFNQYQCQKYLTNKRVWLLNNVICFILLIPFLLLCYFKPRKKNIKNYDAIFTHPHLGRKIIPEELISEFESIYDAMFIDNIKFNLELKDLKFIKDLIIQYPLNFYFLLKLVVRIAMYRQAIQQYNPKAFIVTADFSFTSSVLTLFLNNNNIEHINVLHGETIFRIRHSFFRFNRCYVWDDHYIKMFCKLRAQENNFIISTPPFLFVNIENHRKESQLYDYKYYLGDFNKSELTQIVDSMNKLVSCGFCIKVRPHPRYGDLSLLHSLLENKYIEDFKEVSIEESLANTRNVVGFFTTVLYQAYRNGINVVLDDITYKNYESLLISRDYIIYSKPHFLLSKIIRRRFL